MYSECLRGSSAGHRRAGWLIETHMPRPCCQTHIPGVCIAFLLKRVEPVPVEGPCFRFFNAQTC